MQSAKVENGIVTNIIVGTFDDHIACPPDVGIGWFYDGENFTPPPIPEIPLSQARAQARDDIESHAEVARQALTTPGDGKALVYRTKLSQANAFTAANNPQASDYPLLAAEAQALGIDIAELATTVRARANEWEAKVSRIEAIAQAAKQDVAYATTPEVIQNFIDNLSFEDTPAL